MNSGTLLASLIALAAITGAILHSKRAELSTPARDSIIIALERELEILKAENNTLKSINQVNGEIVLPLNLYKFVEKNLGMEFSPHVKAIKTDLDKLEEAAEYRWIKHFKQAGIENRQYAFELLGILPEESTSYARQLAQLETLPSAGKLGVYDIINKELLLSNEFNIDNIDHKVEVIRLLTIALLELKHPAAENLSDDAFITRDAIIRGRADMIAHRYKNISTKGGAETNAPITSDKQTSILARNIDQFPSKFGRPYIESILLKQKNVFPEIYEWIPKQSSTIYFKVPFIKSNKKSPPRANKENERILIDSSLGQVILRVLIDRLSAQHPELHLELAYDSLVFIQNVNTPETPVLEWKITWTSKDSAKTFTEIFNARGKHTVARQIANTVTITLK